MPAQPTIFLQPSTRQSRPNEERFRLRVVGQEKRSFESKDAAVSAGQVITKAFSVLNVLDAQTGEKEWQRKR
jgi:hypothetical protein